MKNIFFCLTVLSIMCSVNTWSAVVNLNPVGDMTDTSYRLMDSADNVYRTTYQTGFSYDQPIVNLTYDDFSSTFSGTLTATGLKPNFAYQMKLVGNSDIDYWTNEQIGYTGRWWFTQYDSAHNIIDQGNTGDTFYDAHKNDSSYVFQGYLLFDFFVTDKNGNRSPNFFADSSYHVLWKTSQTQKSRTSSDGPITSTTFNPAIGTFYDTDYPQATIDIYAQWESGRALPGELVLTPGEYNCQFILTEESFHSEDILGGNWAGAMERDVTFTVVPIPASIFLLGGGLIGIVGIRRKFKK